MCKLYQIVRKPPTNANCKMFYRTDQYSPKCVFMADEGKPRNCCRLVLTKEPWCLNQGSVLEWILKQKNSRVKWVRSTASL